MANSWQADEEDEEFILKEPTFTEEKPSARPLFPRAISHTVIDAALIVGVFVVTFVMADVASKLVSKWLD